MEMTSGMDWSLFIALSAIIVTIFSARSANVRGEAHHQISKMQGVLDSLTAMKNDYLCGSISLSLLNDSSDSSDRSDSRLVRRQGMAFEANCSAKCDLLESALDLMVRRCARSLLFDADVIVFRDNFKDHLGLLRNEISNAAYSLKNPQSDNMRINARITKLYTMLDCYIGERFRPIFESRRVRPSPAVVP